MDMLVHRSTDADAINAVINHPKVLPWVVEYGQDSLDVTELVKDGDNVLLMCADSGGFLFHQLFANTYEVHTQFLPDTPSGTVRQAALDAAYFMFTATNCMEILTKVPVGNVPALRLATATGFTQDFRGNRWHRHDGETMPIDYLALRYEQWVLSDPRLPKLGHWFHEQLVRCGQPVDHGDDAVHDRFVGLAIACQRGGMPDKGIALYNRWARFYGYQMVRITNRSPLRVDIASCTVEFAGEEIVSCQ